VYDGTGIVFGDGSSVGVMAGEDPARWALPRGDDQDDHGALLCLDQGPLKGLPALN
jgi:hypothetical protein